jgi:hypothetical protein
MDKVSKKPVQEVGEKLTIGGGGNKGEKEERESQKKRGRVKRSSESDDEKMLSSHVGRLGGAARKIGPVRSSRVQGFPGVPER